MAHYKRGYPRTSTRGRRGGLAEVTFRKKHGIKPVRIPSWKEYRNGVRWSDPIYRMLSQEYDALLRKAWPVWYWWASHYPRWWDIEHHSRPARARTRKLEYEVLNGRIDPDEAIWPLNHKPHIYYW